MKISNANLGDSFEKYTDKCLTLKGWKVTRIPDGCKQIGPHKIIRVKAAFDYFATKMGGLSIYYDCKTTAGESFPYSAINQDQIKELLAHEKNGHVAGYIINFRQVNAFCFISAKALSEIVPRGSIKARECVGLGKEINLDILFATPEA